MNDSIGVIICLFNPNIEFLSNNIKVLNKLNLYTILIDDRSECALDKLLEEIDSSKYLFIRKNENLGIGNSLNIGCEYLIKNNFSWVLTLDQDTELCDEWIDKLISVKSNYENILNDAFIFHSIPKDPRTDEVFYYKLSSTNYDNIGKSQFAFTSGSLMSLIIWNKLGKFNENLFLDYIDIDICFRARIEGYSIYSVENAIMNHPVGNRKFFYFMNLRIVLINHSPIRNYYVVRNAYIMRKIYGKYFPEFKKGDRIFILKKCIKAIIFEGEKIKKLFYILLGLIHGYLGIKGRIGNPKN